MKNFKIGSKLLLAFSGIGVLLAAVAWFAVTQLGSMDMLMQDSMGDRLPKVMTTQKMQTAVASFRSAEGLHVLSTDDGGIREAEAEMNAQRATVDRAYAILDASLAKPTARALLGEVRSSWKAYLDANAAVLAFSRQNKNVDATNVMRGRSRRVFETLKKNTDDLARFETGLMTASSAEGEARYAEARLLLGCAVGLALAALGMILVLLVRQIAKPVAAMTGALTELAHGRMDVEVPVAERRDEVGALATAMKQLRDRLAAAERAKAEQTALIVESIGEALSRLAEGDLVSRVDADLTGPFAKLKTDFNAAAAVLQGTLAQVNEAANGINGGAGEIRQASDDLSQRTEQQAASLEQTAAAMDEITGTVRTTAARAGSARGAVRSARDEAAHSGEVVRSAVDAMGGIERTSNEISQIISVIDGIAFQTNLLALNAGVEAARAGDAGKGFAVVASEVRALAQRSAEAAKDVKTRITASSEQVAVGVQLVGETGQALERIITRIGEIDALVSEIAASAEQQATGLHQINTAVGEMDSVTQQNAAMVEEATAAARSLAAEADGLSRQIARFRTGGETKPATGSPVHRLQDRAAAGARRMAAVGPRRGGSAALAVAQDDWAEF